jgi:hypothetical protein
MTKRHAETKGRPARIAPLALPAKPNPAQPRHTNRAEPCPTGPNPATTSRRSGPIKCLIAIPAAGFHQRPRTDGMHAPMIKAEASYVDLVGGGR